MSIKVAANVRMYRLNELGDCFLIAFTAGDKKSHMLIDCGSFRNGAASQQRLETIAKEIKDQLAGQLIDVVVATHQHNDHVSGFVHCEKLFRDEIGIEQVWLSWLDNPRDRTAQDIGEAHNNLKMRLFAARDQLQTIARGRRAAPGLEVVNDILGFYGSKGAATPPELPANAIALLKKIGKQKPLYLKPGRRIDMPGLPAGSVKIHVLGPPMEHDQLYRKDPRKGESYDHALAAASLSATRFLDALRHHNGETSGEEEQYPFNEDYKRRGVVGNSAAMSEIKKRYGRRAQKWRTIDDDWLQQAEGLALFLDTFTNNSSLVLAIELVESGKVLLFAADAQSGNWASWQDVKWETEGPSTDVLLKSTVLYKVGHHASHNATLVQAFEKMDNDDLVALIPVHKKDPNITKEKGWKMPAKNLFKKLVKQTSHRVLQMDDVNPPSCDPKKSPAKAAWKKVGITPKVTDLYIELDIPT